MTMHDLQTLPFPRQDGRQCSLQVTAQIQPGTYYGLLHQDRVE